MNAWAIAGLVVLIIIAWCAFWVGLISLISRLGGWRRLAQTYAMTVASASSSGDRELPHPLGLDAANEKQKEPSRRTFAMQSLSLRQFVGYNNVVHFAVRDEGLAISVMKVFSFGHAPLLLPWKEMTITPTTCMGFKVVRIVMEREPYVPITIRPKLAKQLAAAAGEQWPAASDF